MLCSSNGDRDLLFGFISSRAWTTSNPKNNETVDAYFHIVVSVQRESDARKDNPKDTHWIQQLSV